MKKMLFIRVEAGYPLEGAVIIGGQLLSELQECSNKLMGLEVQSFELHSFMGENQFAIKTSINSWEDLYKHVSDSHSDDLRYTTYLDNLQKFTKLILSISKDDIETLKIGLTLTNY